MTSRFWAASQSALRYALSGGTGTISLNALSLSASTFVVGVPSNGSIFGATGGSTITTSGLPTGFTINSAARTWAYDGTGTVTSGNMTLTETLAGATGSPKANIIAYSVTAAPDTTAPILSLPTGVKTGQTTATIGATTNEGNGTLYGVVTNSPTTPTAAQIKTGKDHTGAAAEFAGSVAVVSTGAKTISATGLTPGAVRYGHTMHEDAATNQSNCVSSASFTLDSATGTIFDTANSSAHYSYANANKTAICDGLGGSTYTALATVGHNGTGDWWWDVSITGGGGDFAGFATAPIVDGQTPLSTANLVMLWTAGDIWSGGSDVASCPALNSSAGTYRFRVKNGKLYVATVSGGTPTWIMGDPAAETGGYDVSAKGPLYPAVTTGAANTNAADFTNWA
jgi:hypothetical protein